MAQAILQYIIWSLVAILYSPIFYQLYRKRWNMIDYTHAYFILPVALGFVWLKHKQIKEFLQKPQSTKNFPGLALLILGCLMFTFGWRKDYLLISTFSLIPLLYGIILYHYGNKIAKTLSFPILYLLLLVPPPLGILDAITLPMRHGVSVATEIILKAFHYPITRDGLLLSIGGHEIYMGAPCSGFRSLITMLSLGLGYTYLIKAPVKNKVILVCSIIPLALLANLLRVLGVCLVHFYFGADTGQKFHDISGYGIFLVLILSMFGLETLLGKRK